MPDALTLTKDWMELLRGIADEAERWRVLEAVYGFSADGTEPDGLSPIGECVFMTIRERILKRKRDTRYLTNRRKNSADIRRSETPTFDANTADIRRSDDLFPVTSNQHRNTDISPSLLDKSNNCSPTGENSTARRVFKVPSLEEVKAIVREKGYNMDAEEFYAYHVANGWRVGRNPMKDVRAAIAYWNRRQNQNRRSPPKRDYSGI